jgi:tetratricopeptide (TPR) repeat protein
MTALREFLRAVDLEVKGDTAWYGAYEAALRADSGWVYPFDGTIRADLARRNEVTGWDLGRKRVATFEREHQLTQGDREYLDLVVAWLAGDAEGNYQATKKLFARRPSEWSPFLPWGAYWSFRLNEVLEHRDLLDAPGFWNAPSRRNRHALYAHLNVGFSLHLLGKYQEAIELSRHIRAEFPDDPIAGTVHEMRGLAALGRIADLERVLDEHERGGTGGWSVSRAVIAALELGTHGQPDAAQAMYRRSVRFLQARVDRGDTTAAVFNDLATSLLYTKDFGELERMLPRLLAAGDSLNYLYNLGAAAAYQGDRPRATEMVRRLARMRSESPYAQAGLLYVQASITAILDDKSEAVELLREARRRGYWLHYNVHQDPDLRGLRGYPAFEEFIRPRQ